MANKNVFLFVPNIIGYVRILLLAMSCYFMLSNHRLALALYAMSYLMDAIDGLAARKLNQSSLVGQNLDMLTDRVATMVLLMTLGHLYHKYFFLFQLLAVVDIVSHWLHSYAAQLRGTSHKVSNSNFLMKEYYENKFVLTSICMMEQMFYGVLFVMHYEDSQLIWTLFLSTPALMFKNYINLLQIKYAFVAIASQDNRQN